MPDASLTFDTLQPIRMDGHKPVFQLAGREWVGLWWDQPPGHVLKRELSVVDGNARYEISKNDDGYVGRHALTLAPGVEIDVRLEPAASVDAAATALMAHTFPTREAAGVLWAQRRENASYSSWTCAFGEHDAGEISHFHSTSHTHWSIKRSVTVGERRFELSCADAGGGSIEDFDSVAARCQSLFLELLAVRGGDAFAAGAKEGAASMRAKILAAANQA